ncbi:MAG: four-carbon acid sugar kinase family protein [Planctomycetota bacterium]
MAEQVLNMQEALKGLPSIWHEDLLPAIRSKIECSPVSLVVLDDDPTGTQTVYDVPVLTNWKVRTLTDEFSKGTTLFYILTNSRSLHRDDAINLAREIGTNVLQASLQADRSFEVISRSDSTLRGHFPAEVDALADAVGLREAVLVIIPFFEEGGRYTIGDVHYVREKEQLVPAAQTPFAKDAVFGYENSNLRQWVEEKTKGRIPASSVQSLSIDEIRKEGPAHITKKLLQRAPDGAYIVNAADYRDLEVVTLGLLNAQCEGVRFLFRTAASFVRVRAGLGPRPLLSAKDMGPLSRIGGLVVVGSHVPRSSEQLSHLLQNGNISGIELRVENILVSESRDREIANVVEFVDAALSEGQDVVVYTSRGLVTGNDDAGSLVIGRLISQALVEVVRSISLQPRYILAKGGITSSDIATQALNITRAKVLGQILPGVPVWRTGPKSKFPDMAYIVFPGNVGSTDAISVVVQSLRGSGN